ncbi:MAG: efflux RND transporter periplasmic adaptor subunit [Ignavibacteriaceae bacterium]
METNKADLSSLRINRSEKYGSGSKKKYLVIISILLVTALVVTGYLLVSSLISPPVEVKLISAIIQSPSQANASLTASGYVVAQRQAAVASKGTGRLVFLGVVEGDKVKQGQIIARIEDNDIKAQLDQAKANLQLQEADLKDAENSYNRTKALIQTGSATQMEVDASEARYNRVLASIQYAKASVTAAQVALENTLIRAPFDGTVLTKNAEIGEIVAPLGASTTSRGAVVTLADMQSLQVEADVSESYIERIILNQDCEIVLDAYPQSGYPGYVAKVVPTADRSKATVLVKIGFKEYDNRVLPEMSAKVSFLSKPVNESQRLEGSALVVPFTAIANRNGRKVIFIVKDEKAVEVPVTTGREFGSYIEIKSGISDGSRVIERVTNEIEDGIKVKVI